ncbi:CapA family protein [Cellulosimicrobium marinum]|uniref:CapA family protein n=1 Tax=Cellulosimicrobium marinum TaxID=1638992 RepID=UPI001E4AD4AA|nr:CapA family protein [Cellulosimicrobium marinum]MCB7137732.1 CapA family protein [Cellulosimicrobium marinum]
MPRHGRPAPLRGRGVLVGTAVAVLAVGVGVLAPPVVRDVLGTDASPGASAADALAPAVVTAEPAAPPAQDVVFTIGATGDILTHMPVTYSARTDEGYDFTPLLTPLDRWVQGVDLALCHLEVPLAPAGVAPTGYPVYGAPAELVRDLAEQGWDGCSTASNHSVDRAMPRVVTTLDALDAAGLGHVGTARTAEEAVAPQVYTLAREGREVRVAHLSATYGTNGLPVPADAPWSVTLLDADALVAQAAAARAAGADLVVVSVHAGVEYTSVPNAQQVDVAERLAASGQVDLVIGHHAHVPQPVTRLDGGPDGTGTWVAYGLGNLVSNQDGDCCDPRTDSGLFLTATVTQPTEGPARVTGVAWTPTTVDRRAGHLVRALVDAVDAPETGSLSVEALGERVARVRAAVGDEAPEVSEPSTPTGPAPVVVPRRASVPAAG